MPPTIKPANPKPPRPVDYTPEFGDVADVRRVFGFRETYAYSLYYDGKIKSFRVPGQKGRRGKRLFDFASIRAYLAECAASEQQEKEAASK
jgi:hypothetical protein